MLQNAVYLLQNSLPSLLSPTFLHTMHWNPGWLWRTKGRVAGTGQLKKGGASAICSQGAHPRPVLTGLLLQAERGFVCFQSVYCGSCTVQNRICFVYLNYWNLLAGACSFLFSFFLSAFVHGISVSYLPILTFNISICLLFFFLIVDSFYSDKRITVFFISWNIEWNFHWVKGSVVLYSSSLSIHYKREKDISVVLPKYLGQFEKKLDFGLEVRW